MQLQHTTGLNVPDIRADNRAPDLALRLKTQASRPDLDEAET